MNAEELATFERALARVESGEARALGLRGEPGIGKSRLLAELATLAHERGVLVLEGRATELERKLTFALLVDALEPLVSDTAFAGAIGELEDWKQGELAGVLPAVGSLAAVEAAIGGERHRVARAVRALLERVAGERPLALLVDDVLMGGSSVGGRAGPAAAPAAPRGRPAGAGDAFDRAPGLEAALAAAEQQGAAEVLEPGPLPLELVGDLLVGVGPAVRRRLHRESGGNPFYLQELSRAGHPRAGRAGPAGPTDVPAPVRAALAGEVAALPADGRSLLEGAAVVGDPFEPGLAGLVAARRACDAGRAGRAAGGGSGASDG